MLLSQLVFQAVKNVKYIDDIEFNIDDFRKGTYDPDLDYRNSINNVFAPLNEAIHRLSDRNKIQNKTTCLGMGVQLYDLPINQETHTLDVKKVVNAFVMDDNMNYLRLPFRQLGRDKIIISIGNLTTFPVWIEYQQDIPHFDYTSYSYHKNKAVDVELKDYGITDTACSYIIEYVQGKLNETIAPELANMHITRAEQYFEDLEEQQTSFDQQVVYNTYGIED